MKQEQMLKKLSELLLIMIIKNYGGDTIEEQKEFLITLKNKPSVCLNLSKIDADVKANIICWTEELLRPTEILLEHYYKILQDNTDCREGLIEAKLTEEEKELLDLSENFDVESLNVIKDCSQDEAELLSFLKF